MAKAGDKKRLEENKKHLQNLRTTIAVANLTFIGVRLLLRRSTSGTAQYVLLAVTSLMYAFCYSGIASSLAPHYGPSGELVYSGADRKTGGLLEYLFDLIYVAAFVQVLGAYTDRAWFALLLIPGYALWLLWKHVLGPWWNTPELPDVPESEAEKKARLKHERQATRAGKFRR